MISRKLVFAKHRIYPYSVPEIVDNYLEWVSITTYMILNRLNLFTLEADTFAIKCSKRGNDVHRRRVYKRFKGVSSLAKKMVFLIQKIETRTKRHGHCS